MTAHEHSLKNNLLVNQAVFIDPRAANPNKIIV